MEKLKEIIENLGWNISEANFGGGDIGWELQQYSPAGEDFIFDIEHNNSNKLAIDNIIEFAENFDEDEHIEMWIEARHSGIEGIPSIRELVEDAKDIHKMLLKLSNYLTEHVRICSECGEIMQEGYITENYEYYCSDECLHKNYTKEEWKEIYTEDGDNYWTSWKEGEE